MFWKSVALVASLAGVLATASAASAAPITTTSWSPGNCQPGTFCIWANTDHPPEGPTATPSLVTSTEWSGRVPAFNFYNYTSRNAEITWSYTYLGSTYTGEQCVPPGSSWLYVPAFVTKVTWNTRTC